MRDGWEGVLTSDVVAVLDDDAALPSQTKCGGDRVDREVSINFGSREINQELSECDIFSSW